MYYLDVIFSVCAHDREPGLEGSQGSSPELKKLAPLHRVPRWHHLALYSVLCYCVRTTTAGSRLPLCLYAVRFATP